MFATEGVIGKELYKCQESNEWTYVTTKRVSLLPDGECRDVY
jgi:hypothetical protein